MRQWSGVMGFNSDAGCTLVCYRVVGRASKFELSIYLAKPRSNNLLVLILACFATKPMSERVHSTRICCRSTAQMYKFMTKTLAQIVDQER